MRNNRKDTSDQRGEGKKHFQRNRDEMQGRDKEREREKARRRRSRSCKTVLLESGFLISRERTGKLD